MLKIVNLPDRSLNSIKRFVIDKFGSSVLVLPLARALCGDAIGNSGLKLVPCEICPQFDCVLPHTGKSVAACPLNSLDGKL
jgi:hypothetical protein